MNHIQINPTAVLEQSGVQILDEQAASSLLAASLTGESSTWTIEKLPIFLNAPPESLNVDYINGTCEETVIPYEISDEAPGTSNIMLPNDIILQFNVNTAVPNSIVKSNNAQLFGQHIFNNKQLAIEPSINDPFEIVSAHKCKACGNLFERYDEIIRHIQNVHVKQEQLRKKPKVVNADGKSSLFLCGKCDDKSIAYGSIEELRQHMITTHNLVYKNEETIDQTKPKELKTKPDESYLQKLVQHQESANKKVKCMIKGCDAGFAQKDIMLKHMEFHVGTMRKRFKCPNCDKLFFIWRTCRAHMWKLHNVDVGLYECSMCESYKCLAPYDLLVHMKMHMGSSKFKPFLCSICGEQFNRLNDLHNHSNSHAPKENWTLIKCPKCDKTFSNNKYLKRHLQSVHDPYMPFICNICGHKCARKAMLEVHLRQHTGEKPYKCDLCDFKTGDPSSFRRHALRHSGLTNYACSLCDYRTIQSSAFKTHMKTKHPGEEGYFKCDQCPFSTVNAKLFEVHTQKHQREQNSIPTIVDQPAIQTVPNVEDEETQIGLFPDHLEDAVDTGGITIPAGIEN